MYQCPKRAFLISTWEQTKDIAAMLQVSMP